MVTSKLLQGHLLLDGPRLLLCLEFLVDVHLSGHLPVALEGETVAPEMDLSELVAVVDVPGSLSLKPAFEPCSEVVLQSVFCEANL